MIIDCLILLAGLVVLIGGGEMLIRGAASIAAHAGVSPVLVGLTVVAFGTSAPELAVSLSAALAGNPDITFGNVIGSNIANIGLLLGITALIRPVVVHGQIVQREIPMMLLCTAATLVLGLDRWLDAGTAQYHRGDGVVLLLFFCVFLYYTSTDASRARKSDPLLRAATELPGIDSGLSLGLATAFIVLGLTGLVGGGNLVVDSAVGIARRLSLSEAAIGATIIAIGTSLPELVTCLIAARKGQHDLAVGNIVGSNIFNLLFVLGVTATIHPVAIPDGAWVDLVAMAVLAVVLLPFATTHRKTITRGEGMVLFALYCVYATSRLYR